MNKKFESRLILVFRYILAAVFIYAGVLKIINPTDFAGDIENYQMLPYFFISVMAVILPWMEVVCGILLIIGVWLKPASFLVLALNVVFIIAIATAVLRGLDISCGCFSSHSTQVGLQKIIEDLFYAGMALFVLLKAKA